MATEEPKTERATPPCPPCRILAALVLTAGVVGPSRAQDIDQELKRRLLDEAPHEWDRLREQRPQVQGSVSVVVSVDGDRSTLTLDFRTNRSGRSAIETHHTSQGVSATAHVSNADYSFILTRRPETEIWTLTRLHIGPADGAPEPIGGRQKTAAAILQAPMVLGTEPLADLFRHPSFAVRRVSRNGSSGGRFVDVDFDRPNEFRSDRPNEFNPVQGGRLTLDPQRHWCLISAELRLKSLAGIGTEKVANELIEKPSPIPLVKKSHTVEEWTLGTGKTTVIRREFDFKASQPDSEPPDADFRLTAFGLPEPVGIVPPARPTPRYVWFLIAAGGLGVFALLFRILSRRLGPRGSMVPQSKNG